MATFPFSGVDGGLSLHESAERMARRRSVLCFLVPQVSRAMRTLICGWLAWAALTVSAVEPPKESGQRNEEVKKSDVADEKSSVKKPETQAESKANAKKSRDNSGGKAGAKAVEDMPIPVSPSWVRVARDYPIWVDLKKKEVIVKGRIAIQKGALEMFACPKGTKEHESVVAIESPAKFVHLALLAVGARPGKPVAFDPEYRPATGTTILIDVVWKDAQGKVHRHRAQEWVKNARTGKPLQYDWVFGGSSFFTDPATGERYYAAEAGELVCVSNFSTATLDLPIESTAANRGLLFVANSEKVPPRGTPVLMILRPKSEDAKNKAPSAKDRSDASKRKDSPNAKKEDRP